MTFGFATGEFEVTEERLGTYRPEEHIDNPKVRLESSSLVYYAMSNSLFPIGLRR